MMHHSFSELAEWIRPIAQKYGVDKVLLFGSEAKGTAGKDSDYDFLIAKGELDSLVQYVQFIDELEETLKRHVDVITDTTSEEQIVQIAMQEGVLLYERPHERSGGDF